MRPIVYHIPVCPFSQRLEILLTLKGLKEQVDFQVIDITVPRPQWLLDKNPGSTALPVLETEDGRILSESMVLLRYLEQRFPEPPVFRHDPYEHAVESMFVTLEGALTNAGYGLVMNQDPARRGPMQEALAGVYERMNRFLERHAPEGPFLFERFGYAECVFTPILMRFWFVEYYEDFDIPTRFERLRRFRDACFDHPATRQVSREEIVKVYYDYARGAGNGALLPGRTRSSFTFEPHWRERPWPPQDKYREAAGDRELGLV